GQVGDGLRHLVEEALPPLALAGLALFPHRRVVLARRSAAELARPLVRGLLLLLLQGVDLAHPAEPPFQQPGAVAGDQHDAGGPALVQQFEQGVYEGAVVEHDPVGHGHLAVQPHLPVVAERGEHDPAAARLERGGELVQFGGEPVEGFVDLAAAVGRSLLGDAALQLPVPVLEIDRRGVRIPGRIVVHVHRQHTGRVGAPGQLQQCLVVQLLDRGQGFRPFFMGVRSPYPICPFRNAGGKVWPTPRPVADEPAGTVKGRKVWPTACRQGGQGGCGRWSRNRVSDRWNSAAKGRFGWITGIGQRFSARGSGGVSGVSKTLGTPSTRMPSGGRASVRSIAVGWASHSRPRGEPGVNAETPCDRAQSEMSRVTSAASRGSPRSGLFANGPTSTSVPTLGSRCRRAASQVIQTPCEWVISTTGGGRSASCASRAATRSAVGRMVSFLLYGAPVLTGHRAAPRGWPPPGPA